MAFSLMHLSLGFWLPRCCIDQVSATDVSATDVSATQMLLSTYCVICLCPPPLIPSQCVRTIVPVTAVTKGEETLGGHAGL